MIFENNLKLLRQSAPELAEVLGSSGKETSHEVLRSRSGALTLRINDITLHSLYDPVKEAKEWVRHYRNRIEEGGSIIVLGFGLGYHLAELCKITEKPISVIEPDAAILKTAFEHIDLSTILNKIKLFTHCEIGSFADNAAVLSHNPSVSISSKYFENLKNIISAAEYINKGMKIMVVGPIYGGSLPIARYCSATLKKMGHNVELMDCSRFSDALFYAKDIAVTKNGYNNLVNILSGFLSAAVIERAESFQPDLVFALAQAPLSSECVIRLRQKGIRTAYWFVEDFRFMDYWKKIAPCYDYFFTIQKDDFFKELEKEKIRNYCYLPTAAHPDEHKPMKITDEEKKYYGSDISFVGAGYYNRKHFFKGLLDFDFKIWGTDWDMNSALAKTIQRAGARIDTNEVTKIFNAAKININLHSSTYHRGINPFGDFLNPRLFEIISCGGFQLVDRRMVLDELLIEGEEIIVFDSLEDLRSKIKYYLDNPVERENIVNRGRERVLKDHTYECRMKKMLEFIASKGFAPPEHKSDGEDVNALLKESGRDTELGIFLMQFNDKKKISLSDIVEHIHSAEGDISATEKLFLAMNEFVR